MLLREMHSAPLRASWRSRGSCTSAKDEASVCTTPNFKLVCVVGRVTQLKRAGRARRRGKNFSRLTFFLPRLAFVLPRLVLNWRWIRDIEAVTREAFGCLPSRRSRDPRPDIRLLNSGFVAAIDPSIHPSGAPSTRGRAARLASRPRPRPRPRPQQQQTFARKSLWRKGSHLDAYARAVATARCRPRAAAALLAAAARPHDALRAWFALAPSPSLLASASSSRARARVGITLPAPPLSSMSLVCIRFFKSVATQHMKLALLVHDPDRTRLIYADPEEKDCLNPQMELVVWVDASSLRKAMVRETTKAELGVLRDRVCSRDDECFYVYKAMNAVRAPVPRPSSSSSSFVVLVLVLHLTSAPSTTAAGLFRVLGAPDHSFAGAAGPGPR